MIDPDEVVRAYLMARPKLAACGDRIIASDRLPTDYKPTDGPALLFTRRGGGDLSFSSSVLGTSYQFRAYAETEELASETTRALFDSLNDAQASKIKSARLEIPSQPMREPLTDWPFELSFYRITLATA